MAELPDGGEQLSDLAAGHRGQPVEDVREVFLGIYSVPAATLDEGVNDGAAPTRIRVSDKEPAAFSDRGMPHVIFH
jgi:hypothetical protein